MQISDQEIFFLCFCMRNCHGRICLSCLRCIYITIARSKRPQCDNVRNRNELLFARTESISLFMLSASFVGVSMLRLNSSCGFCFSTTGLSVIDSIDIFLKLLLAFRSRFFVRRLGTALHKRLTYQAKINPNDMYPIFNRFGAM